MRLAIELVPSTCWFSNLRSELRSVDWKLLKACTFQAAGHVCEICGGRGQKWPVECHEIWEYEDTTHTQILRGLIALCPACHEVKHIGFAQLNGQFGRALNHLQKVNGITEPEARAYVKRCFETWALRSKFEWVLDLSWLEGKGIQPRRMT